MTKPAEHSHHVFIFDKSADPIKVLWSKAGKLVGEFEQVVNDGVKSGWCVKETPDNSL